METEELERAKLAWVRGEPYKPQVEQNLPERKEYKPLSDPRMVEAMRRAKELQEAGESLYD